MTCDLGVISSGAGATLVIVADTTTAGTYSNNVTVSFQGTDVNPVNNSASEDTVVLDTAIGGRVWADRDGDGIQGASEPSVGSVLVELLDAGSGLVVSFDVTGADGTYLFTLSSFVPHRLRFNTPSGWVLTTPDLGGDDTLDSDADLLTGETPVIGPAFTIEDPSRWDAGIRQLGTCITPDEEVFILGVRLSTDGNDFTILDFQDPNQPSEVSGYNVYRSSNPALAPDLWSLVASNIVDMDETVGNTQYVDQSNDISPSGVWFYEIAPYNAACDAEGPR